MDSVPKGDNMTTRVGMGCIPPGKIVSVDDPPRYIYWSKPQNPDSWSDSTGSHYSHVVCDDLTQEFKDYLDAIKPRGKFEELLDRFDTLHAEFGE